MKRLTTLCVLAIAALFASAQERLNIILKDKSYITYSFSERPKVTIAGSTLNISTESVQIQFAMSQVSRFQFGEEPGDLTAVDEVVVNSPDSDADTLTLRVFTLDGVLVRSGSTPNRLNYSDLPKGVYIIRSGNNSHKLYIR